MPHGILKTGTRQFQMPAGRAYVEGSPLFLAAVLDSFEFEAEITSNTLDLSFGSFELSDFHITRNTFSVALGDFEVSFTATAGAIATLDLPFASFEFSASLDRSGSFDLPLGDFTCALTAGLQTTLSFDLNLGVFTASFRAANVSVAEDTTADYQVWVVTRDTKQHATYTQYPIESLVEFNGKLVAAFEDGIYEIGGTDDDGTEIAASLRWASSELGSRQPKRLDSVYINGRLYAQCLDVVVSTDEAPERIYTTVPNEDSRRFRVLPARGLSGHTWKLGVSNVDGGDFELFDAEVTTVPLSRHTR